jgi:hypothetical protein
MIPTKQILEGQLRENYGRAVYSHKTHEKCADLLLERQKNIKLIQIFLATITTGSFISTILGSGSIGSIVGVIASTILLMLNAYTKDYDLGELAQKHKQSANDIWLVREQYLSLITDLASGQKNLVDTVVARDKLVVSLHSIYSGAPSTTYAAYKKAQESLKHFEDMTFTNQEIDAFLPKQLRRDT